MKELFVCLLALVAVFLVTPDSDQLAAALEVSLITLDSDPQETIAIQNIAVDKGLCPERSHCTDWKPIRFAWDVPEYASAANEAVEGRKTNRWAKQRFQMEHTEFNFTSRIRDPSWDRIISGTLLQGQIFDKPIVKEITRHLERATKRRATQISEGNLRSNNKESQKIPIMLDIGANIGYMTSIGLSMGARVISFEPMRENLGCLLATVRKNGWQERSTVIHNAVSNEPSVVTMKPTNSDINRSNGHVTSAVCTSDAMDGQKYGVDYMEAVTIDQVMGEHFVAPGNPNPIDRIDVIKIDVETFEINVIEGMIRTLCHIPIDAILVEVEYIKNHKSCKAEEMHGLMKQLGFKVVHGRDGSDVTTTDFNMLPANIVYVQWDETRGIAPFEYFKHDKNHVCQDVPPFAS